MRSPSLRPLLLATATVVVACSGALASSASAASVSASEGIVQATLSYEGPVSGQGGQGLTNMKLAINRSGVSFYDQPVTSHDCATAPCGLENAGGGPLQVKDLEGNGQPDVILGLNTGGAHCCTIEQVFWFDPGVMAYRLVEHDFGDPGAVVSDVAGNGHLEFRSADDRFAYAFGSYAFSGLPVQIWQFREGSFVDITKQFPTVIAADAVRQLKEFDANRGRGLGLGEIAAWAADEYLLGHRSLVKHTLEREARGHHLRSYQHMNPEGTAFIKQLGHFLARNGYG
ncbi:MAG TPA: hypothetical protein VKG62_02510 [Solirubrobacteraceae bacterium]|nr:hypothetical protein [Solirubrobacteraceae bacterium]